METAKKKNLKNQKLSNLFLVKNAMSWFDESPQRNNTPKAFHKSWSRKIMRSVRTEQVGKIKK